VGRGPYTDVHLLQKCDTDGPDRLWGPNRPLETLNLGGHTFQNRRGALRPRRARARLTGSHEQRRRSMLKSLRFFHEHGLLVAWRRDTAHRIRITLDSPI
jgi:hypothetical protein